MSSGHFVEKGTAVVPNVADFGCRLAAAGHKLLIVSVSGYSTT